jgi:hypothetical protein
MNLRMIQLYYVSDYLKSIKSSGWVLFALLLTSLYGGFLRFYKLGEQSFWMDEVFTTVHAKAILLHGYPILENGLTSWDYFLTHYITALGLSLFYDVQYGARFFSAMAGTLSIAAFYFVCLKLSRSKYIALVSTLLFTFMTYEIAWCRQARGYIFLQLFSFSSIACFIEYLEKKKMWWLVLSLVFVIFSLITHRAGYLVFTFIIVLGFVELYRHRRLLMNVKQKNYIQMVCITGVFFIFFIFLFLQNTNSNIYDSLKDLISPPSNSFILPYIEFIYRIFKVILLWSLIGVFVSIIKKDRYNICLFCTIGLYFFAILFQTPYFHYRYLLPIIPFILYFAALGFLFLLENGIKFHKRVFDYFLITIIFIFSVFSMDWNIRPYHKYYLGITAPQPEWKEAYFYIANDCQNKNITSISTFPEFHNIYFGSTNGRKYYLPFSLTGRTKDIRRTSKYVKAKTISSLKELKSKKGYVVLDNFGLRSLINKKIFDYLLKSDPVHIIEGPYMIYIWKI